MMFFRKKREKELNPALIELKEEVLSVQNAVNDVRDYLFSITRVVEKLNEAGRLKASIDNFNRNVTALRDDDRVMVGLEAVARSILDLRNDLVGEVEKSPVSLKKKEVSNG